MAEIEPFRGILYRVPEDELADLLAPPYDIIGPDLQERLYARDPRNVVRIVRNRGIGEDGYRDAGETYRRWLAEGILAADREPGFYLMEQAFLDGERRLRRYGLIARFRVEDLSTPNVLGHERPQIGPSEDRWRLLLATRANFSPVFFLFRDSGQFAARVAISLGSRPFLAVTDEDDVRHRLWRISDPAQVGAFREALRLARVYIADGHHRYAAALRYSRQQGPQGGWTLGYFTPLEAPGLVVLPFHRLLLKGPSLEEARRKLGSAFRLSARASLAKAAQAAVDSHADYAFGLAEPDGSALLAEADAGALPDAFPPTTPASLKALDAQLIHEVVLPRYLGVGEEAIRYVPSLADIEEALAGGRCRLALLMRSTPVQAVVNVADAGQSLPLKSTFFFPKLPSGLVIHPLPG